MITPNFILLQAQQAQAGSQWTFWVMMIAIFVIMYFFMIRPQNKRQKEIQNFQNSLTEGLDVVTNSGIHGVIRRVDETDNTVTLEIATGVKIKVDRAAIMRSIAPKA